METEKFCLLVYDDDADMRADLRLILARYSIEKDVDLQIDWFSRQDQAEQIPRLIGGTQIALINAAMGEPAIRAGRFILDYAPDCLLAYYGGPPAQLEKLLSTRPVAYQDHPESMEAWKTLLSKLCSWVRQGNCFRWKNRNQQCFLPYSAIYTIQSDRNYICIHTWQGEYCRMLGKLDEVERQLPEGEFLRIHKSTLVNRRRVYALDRGRRCLMLENGTEAYISKAHYKEIADQFDAAEVR